MPPSGGRELVPCRRAGPRLVTGEEIRVKRGQDMRPVRIFATTGLIAAMALVQGCSNREANLAQSPVADRGSADRETIWDLFGDRDDPNRTIEVNRYIWTAAQDVLSFLPLETADPFSGVLAYGYGQPPGGGPAYRATVYVQDPALDARSLNVALSTRSGPVTPATARAVEDAILTRARQLRVSDGAL